MKRNEVQVVLCENDPLEKEFSVNIENEEVTLLSTVNHVEYKAKKKKWHSWVDNKVYSVVPDLDHNRITRWIGTKKEMKDKIIIKPRLISKVFQDEDSDLVRSDSHTCSNESLRIILNIIAILKWACHLMDIKIVFLQERQF